MLLIFLACIATLCMFTDHLKKESMQHELIITTNDTWIKDLSWNESDTTMTLKCVSEPTENKTMKCLIPR